MPNQRILTSKTVAQVRSGVVAALVCAATDLDSELRESLPRGRYTLALSGAGRIRRFLRFDSGRALESRSLLPSLTLRFASARAMAVGLGGQKSTVIPLPGGPSFLKALKAFMISSRRVGELTAQKKFANDSELARTTEMLMTAALRGVVETAMADSWTAAKASHMSNGIVELCVSGAGGSDGSPPESHQPDIGLEGKDTTLLRGWIRRSGNLWESGRGYAPGKVNARLEFANMETAFGLFSGSVAALGALGRGTVSIRGRISMIQVLFPLLDRFSEIMSWGKGEDR